MQGFNLSDNGRGNSYSLYNFSQINSTNFYQNGAKVYSTAGQIPNATPSNGDTTHYSTADQIYSWVTGLSYATVSYVNNQITGVGGRVDSLNSTSISMYSNISGLQSSNTTTNSRVDSLNSTVGGIYTNVSTLQSSSNAYYSNISSLQSSNTTTNSRIDNMYGNASLGNQSYAWGNYQLNTSLIRVGNESWIRLNQLTYNNLSITDITSAIGNATALDNATIIRSGNISWIRNNQLTYNNLSISDITSAIGNATALDNATIIRAGNISWIRTNQLTYNNLSLSDIISGIGNATAVNNSLQSEITSRQGNDTNLYGNASQGNLSYSWASANHTNWDSAYTNMNQYYTNSSNGNTAYGWANANHTNWDSAYGLVGKGLYNNTANFTTYLSDGKVCTWNNTASKFECITTMTSLAGYYNNIANVTSYLSDGKVCVYNNSASKLECLTTMTSLMGYFNNTLNVTTYVSGGKVCTWNNTASKIECLSSATDTNDTTAVNALQSKTANMSGTNCTAGNFQKGYDANNIPLCDAPAGGGDITSIQSYDSLIYNGSDSGDVKLRVNMTYFNLNASYASSIANGNWTADKSDVVANASRYYGSNSSLITTANGTWVSGVVGNYSAVSSAIYTNISTALGYYGNASLGASLYSNASQGATAYSWANANHSYWDSAYTNMNQYYTNASAYPLVASALYTNISTALGYYSNASLGASYYSNASQGATAYSNMNQYYTNASNGNTAYGWGYYGANLSLITTSNGTWVSGAVGNYSSVASALYTNISQGQGYYSNASQGAQSYTWANANHTNWDTAYTQKDQYYSNASRYYGSNTSLITDQNGTWVASQASSANGNWSGDKSSYFSKTDSYTNLSQGALAYAWGYYGANNTIISTSNASYIASTCSSANGNYSAVSSLLYTNITQAQGYYSNASLGASLYANASNGNTAYGWGYYGSNTSILRVGNESWIKANQYTYNNLSASDVVSAVGNATAVNASSNIRNQITGANAAAMNFSTQTVTMGTIQAGTNTSCTQTNNGTAWSICCGSPLSCIVVGN
jgi:hypothetical protein